MAFLCLLFIGAGPKINDDVLIRDRLAQTDWKGHDQDEITELFLEFDSKLRKEALDILVKAKVFLINGNTLKARRELEKISDRNKNASKIRDRYLATIYFIENQYSKSLEILNAKHFQNNLSYKQICLLRLLNFLALNKYKELSGEFTKCEAYTINHSPTDFLWLDALVSMANKDKRTIQGLNISSITPYKNSLDKLKIWLKLGLYLNKENIIIPELPSIHQDFYESKTLRELVGLIHYRAGNKKKGLDFIEDINSVNSENLRGVMRLENKEYELAYGHFQLALKKKENSSNALIRALPLAWKLGKWKDGHDLATKVFTNSEGRQENLIERRKRTVLRATFLQRLERPTLALKELRELDLLFQGRPPREVEQLNAYNALILGDNSRMDTYIDSTCKKLDGLNCWLQMQRLIWPSFDQVIQREDKIEVSEEFTIEKLKSKAQIAPLKDPLYVDQRDIEELDDMRFKIAP